MVVITLYNKWKGWLQYWKIEIFVLILLFRVPDLPRIAKLMLFALLSYIFSPIDLIPDFIPLIGHLDDFLLIPITLWWIKKVTPNSMIEEVRQDLDDNPDQEIFKGKGPKIMAGLIIAIWLFLTYWIVQVLNLEQYIEFL